MLSLEPKESKQQIEGQKNVLVKKVSLQARRGTSGNHGKHGN
jgi:hypothetical protein